MLGRRAAVVGSILVLAVTGGTAFAATHGSSNSTKPNVHPVIRPHTVAPAVVVTGHHCHHSGNIAASL